MKFDLRRLITGFISVFSLCVFGIVAGEPVTLDDGTGSEGWKFINGAEFPGAKGGISTGSSLEGTPTIDLKYDFTAGGKYVAGSWSGKIPSEIKSIKLEISSDNDASLLFRVTDSTGKIFQAHKGAIKGGKTEVKEYSMAKWESSWGGKGAHKQPVQPLKTIYIGAAQNAKNPLSGTLHIKSMKVETAENVDTSVPYSTGEAVNGFVGSWGIKGAWGGGWGNPVFRLSAEPSYGAKPAIVSFTLPQVGRNSVKRYTLAPDKAGNIFYTPKFLGRINPRQQYKIKIEFESDNNSWTGYAVISGSQADQDLFGPAKKSAEVKGLPFGTCAHFNYGMSGPFSGWRPYKVLIDKISDAGLKWIRDGVKLEKDEATGKYQVRQRDLDWIKYAKDKGIETIAVFWMGASETPEGCAERAVAMVEQTHDLVSVYELGNEPNNFGGWIKKYGGTWNGKEKDNSTCQWVKEHLKNTNAAAEAIKKKFPNVTLIGTGACAPTNFRYLELGLSPAVEGVVEHPYSFSLPAERVPYHTRLKKRDGIEVGDSKGSFRGLIESYYREFKKTKVNRSVWVTEFGWTTFDFNGENEKGLYAGYSEDVQAMYLLRRQLLTLTTPIPASCQYDFLDDYGSTPNEAEANFGIIRSDHSPKPAYTAIQRLCSTFSGFKYDGNIKFEAEAAPLHRAAKSKVLLVWDGADIKMEDSVETYGFVSADQPEVLQLAVWSAQPASGEFSKRFVSLKVKGAASYAAKPVAMDLLTGESFDLQYEIKDGDVVLNELMLGGAPLVVRLYK